MHIHRRLWPRRLRSQLILGIALVHLLLMSVFVVDMIARQYKFLHHQSRQQALSLANELAVAANTHVLGNDFDGLERVIQNYKNFPDLKYAMILAPDNEVLSHTDISYVGKTALDSVSRRIGKEPGSHILLADDEIVDAVAPVTQAGSTIAWARVAISQDYIYSNLTAILRNGVFYILAAIAIGALVGVLMGNRLTRGLYKLVAAAEKIRAGDRNLRAADSDSFEVGRLAVAFNQMLDDIDARGSILESVFQNNEGAIGLYDKDLRYVLFNRQFAENHHKMTGKYPVAGEPLYSDFPSEVIEQRRALVQNVLKGKKEVVEANYLIDGRRAYYRTSFNPVLVDGEITGVTTNTINLTAIKEAEAELKESEEKFRTLVEQS